jgi:hypothetical protein
MDARPSQPPGQRKVAAIVAGGIEDLELQADRRKVVWPTKGDAFEGIKPGAWRGQGFIDDTEQLPDKCPVVPLGYDGENFYFVDTAGQVFCTGDKAMGVERMQKLFMGAENFLCWAWPAYGRGGVVSGFKAEEARRDLFAACYDRGPWSPTDMVRGRGAWRGADGELILHCGEFLWIDGKKQPAGEHGDYFYVRRPRTIAPWSQPVELEDNPAVQLVEILRTWNFVRGDVDVMLVLGWIAAALYGAALDWRPSIFFVGDQGTGKSELHRVLKAILMRGLISTTNATSAGLYQLVGHDALPIAVDELEGEDAPEQTQQIIKMARDAASGSVRIRGGANHQGVEFAARSTFLFSAINPPPLPPASLSRLAMIQMRPLKKTDSKPPVIAAAETIGPRLLRRMADGWRGDFPRLYAAYQDALREHGHDQRGQNTFGTFLAAAHTLLGDEGMDAAGLEYENLFEWGSRLAAENTPEVANRQANWSRCIEELFIAQVDAWNKGERRTVGQILTEFLEQRPGDNPMLPEHVNHALAPAGLALVRPGLERDGWSLAVPQSGKDVAKLLQDTSYAGRGPSGSWSTALAQGPENIILKQVYLRGRDKPSNRVSIAGTQRRCTFINLEELQKWQAEQA